VALGVLAARTLLSDGHGEAVAHVCNYSGRPYTYKVDSFLDLAELVVHVTAADGKAAELSLATSSGLCVSGQPVASIQSESSDLQSDLMLHSKPVHLQRTCTTTCS